MRNLAPKELVEEVRSSVPQLLAREVKSLVPQILGGEMRSTVPQILMGKVRSLVPQILVGVAFYWIILLINTLHLHNGTKILPIQSHLHILSFQFYAAALNLSHLNHSITYHQPHCKNK